MLDLVIQNGLLVTPRGQQPLDLGVADGSVAGWFVRGRGLEAAETIDAGGLWVLPGIVDAHFHCRAPAHPEREDFQSGTGAAAAGGVTTIFEMPITTPAATTGAVIRSRRELGEREAYIDFALWAGGGDTSQEDVDSCAAEGAIGFKIFTHRAPPGRESEFVGLAATGPVALRRSLERIAQTGLPATVHSESDELLYERIEQLQAAGRTDPRAHGESRPPYVEDAAVSMLLVLAEATGARVHVAHASTRGTVERVRAARRRGLEVSMETCPHYLVCTEDDFERVGPYGKVNPPLRSAEHVAALWEGLADGTIDVVASDHSPYTVDEKEAGWTDIWKAGAGLPSIEFLGPLLLAAVQDGRITLERALWVLTEGPARLGGLYPRKGTLDPGCDADVVLYDPAASWTVQLDRLFCKSRQLARLFEGWTIRGRVVRTLVRGMTVYERGQIVGRPGHGQQVWPRDLAVGTPP